MVPRKAFHISVAPRKAYTSTALRRHFQRTHIAKGVESTFPSIVHCNL